MLALPRRPGRPFRTALKAATAITVTAIMLGATPAHPAANTGAPFLIARKAMPAPAGFGSLCNRYGWVCASSGRGRAADPAVLHVADRINRTVNHQVRPLSDRRQYGREEVWDLPTRRGGDCEDFALLKKLRLIEAGIAPENLLVATVLDLNKAPHAVLVIRTTSGDYVLDNLRDGIRPWQRTGYSFLLMQDPRAPGRWNAIFAGGIFSA